MRGVGINAASFLISYPFHFLQITHLFCFIPLIYSLSLCSLILFSLFLSPLYCFLECSGHCVQYLTGAALILNNSKNSNFEDKERKKKIKKKSSRAVPKLLKAAHNLKMVSFSCFCPLLVLLLQSTYWNPFYFHRVCF